jgi:hypothetical protein
MNSWSRIRKSRAWLGAALMGAAALAASAQNTTMNYFASIAEVSGSMRWSNCAFSGEGTLHAVFGHPGPADSPVWYVSYDGRTGSTPLAITGSTTRLGLMPNIAANKLGVVAVVWGQASTDGVYLRVLDPDTKTWGAVETVAEGYGNDEPCVVVDSKGSIYIAWFTKGSGGIYVRAKINGQWEDIFRQPEDGLTKQHFIAVGPDDFVHMVWMDKELGYFTGRYSYRSRGTGWTTPTGWTIVGEPTHPSIALTPDNVPWVASGDATVPDESFSEIWVMNLNRTDQRFKIGQDLSQHYPRIVSDINGKLHVVIQTGSNDFGYGAGFSINIGGSFLPFQQLDGNWPMEAGAASDFGINVAACWTSINFGTGTSSLLINTLYMVSPTVPPLNASLIIQAAGLLKSSSVSYVFNWQKNPLNNDENLTGYRIFISDSTGAWAPYLTVSPTTLSATIKFPSRGQKPKFALAAVSKSGFESAKVTF